MLYISSCHDRTISIVEVARSCLLLITALIRITAFTARECYRKRRESEGLPTREELAKRNRPCRCCIYGAITLGILLKIMAFILLFALNNLTSTNGAITFKNPKGVFNAEPNVEKYAVNVSIYAQIRNRNQTWGWFPLVALSDVTFLKNCTTKLSLMEKKSRIEVRCARNYKSSQDIKKSPITRSDREVEVRHSFRFIEPTSRLLLGNVEYMTLGRKGLTPEAQVQLKYFCTGIRSDRDILGFAIGLIPKKEYDYEGDKVLGSDKRVSEATYCWKTGKFRCEMRGLRGPVKVAAFSQ